MPPDFRTLLTLRWWNHVVSTPSLFQVNGVVSPNVFDRPEAVLSVQVEGVSEGAEEEHSFCSPTT